MKLKIEEIPRLPQVSMELIQHAFGDEPEISHVASIIERDPTLTAKLFQTVHSASFGLKVEVSSISQAVSIIGLDALRSTIVSLALGDYFLNNNMGNAMDPKRYCSHSLATGVIMQNTAQVLGMKKAGQLYLMGLLHDLGKYAMDSLPDSNYKEVMRLTSEGMTFEAAERVVFGVDNRKIWIQLAESWNFPQEIIQLYKGSAEGKITVSTRKLMEDASKLADSLGYTFTPDHITPEAKERDIFSLLSTQRVAEIGDTVEKKVKVLLEVMNLPIPTAEEINKILFRTTHQLSQSNAKYIRTHNELEYRVTVLEELTKVFTGIIRTLDSESLAFSVLESLMEGFHLDGAFMIAMTGTGQCTGYSARKDDNGEPDVSQIRVEREKLSPTLQKCLDSQEPIKVNRPAEEEELKNYLGKVSLAWLAPVRVRGQLSAVLGLGVRSNTDPRFNNSDFGKILAIVSGEVGLSMDNTRLYKHMQKEARYDALTTLLNRRTIMKVLASEFARYKRKGIPLTMAIFDMDHFKSINDTRGHLSGDDFLIKTAATLQSGVRESDYIGRYGGDEFVAVFPDTAPEDGYMVVERMRKKLLKCCEEFGGPDLGKKLSVSVGVAAVEESMTQPDQLILNADKALYTAKESGRNQSIIFEPAHVT